MSAGDSGRGFVEGTHPVVELFSLLHIWVSRSQLVGIVKGNDSQLMQNTNLGKDMKVAEFSGLLVLAVGMRHVGGLVLILSTDILIPIVHPAQVSEQSAFGTGSADSRNVPSRGDPVDQAETNVFQDCTSLMFRTFDLEVLKKVTSASYCLFAIEQKSFSTGIR